MAEKEKEQPEGSAAGPERDEASAAPKAADKPDPKADGGDASAAKGDSDAEAAPRDRASDAGDEQPSKATVPVKKADKVDQAEAGDEKPSKVSAKKADKVDPSDADADESAPREDEAAQRVAEALGVADEGDGEAAPEKEEAEAPKNRAARRREEALRRRKKSSAAAPAVEVDDEDLPRDRNKRAKELLARRREQASGGSRPINLLPGEMVDDALARTASLTSKWIRANSSKIQWVILAAVLGGGGYLIYKSQVDKKAAAASDALYAAVAADRGRILPEDKRSEEEKEFDATRVFKTPEERSDTALASYKKVVQEHPNGGPAILAKLGQAGVLLDKKDYVGALELFSAVASSPLAGADPDVKGRAVEGLALAKEGKGDIDGAIAQFKELEGNDMRGYKELAMYHQGRLLLAKGQTDAAKDMLSKVRTKLREQPTGEGQQFQYLQAVVDDYLRSIDPALVPAKPLLGGAKGNAVSPEQLERVRKLLEEKSQKKGEHEGHGH